MFYYRINSKIECMIIKKDNLFIKKQAVNCIG